MSVLIGNLRTGDGRKRAEVVSDNGAAESNGSDFVRLAATGEDEEVKKNKKKNDDDDDIISGPNFILHDEFW